MSGPNRNKKSETRISNIEGISEDIQTYTITILYNMIIQVTTTIYITIWYTILYYNIVYSVYSIRIIISNLSNLPAAAGGKFEETKILDIESFFTHTSQQPHTECVEFVSAKIWYHSNNTTSK